MLFRRTPQAPVSDEARLWLDGAMQRLVEMFGLERVRQAPLVLANQEFFPDQWQSPQEGVELLLQRVCPLMGVAREGLELAVLFDEEEEPMRGLPYDRTSRSSFAGLYREGNEERETLIVVKLDKHSDPVSIVSILAHELGHVLLLGEGRISRDEADGELLTDLLTIFLGFGVFTANSVFRYRTFQDHKSQGWSMKRQGYLSEMEIAYALALFARLREEKKPAWAKHLNGNVAMYFDRSMRYLVHQANL